MTVKLLCMQYYC